MLDKDLEPFSNPLAPESGPVVDRRDSHRDRDEEQGQPLTNADFRKLMMTPRVGLSTPGSALTASVRKTNDSSAGSRPKSVLRQELNENRKKKKKFYATLKKQEDDTLLELAKKYRDRARERRDGANPDYIQETESSMTTTAAYRAVAPDMKSGLDAAERRKQVIQESKFLGGDMEHTHLVKGLDLCLLQKVKQEMMSKETDIEIDLDLENETEEDNKDKDKDKQSKSKHNKSVADSDVDNEDPFAIKSKLANNMMNVLFNRQMQERNELFFAGRMAYLVDLEDEFADSDIPTTVIRSKADCPNIESLATLSTNDIVINKLTQILSYLRHGSNKKNKKPNKESKEPKIPLIGDDSLKKSDKHQSKTAKVEDSIYGDIGEYVPELKRKESRSDGDRDRVRDKDKRSEHKDREHRDRDRNRDKRSNTYFDKTKDEDEYDLRRKERERESKIISITNTISQLKSKTVKSLDQEMPDSYAECYPGAPEHDDAIGDSDDEVDYSKMDKGNKKGLIGRWDFDTAEEYGDYMSNKEALPKAAFQYGLKMVDGRKTRRTVPGKRDEKAKLDRDLQKINAIIAKRKAESSDTGIAFNLASVEHKRHKS